MDQTLIAVILILFMVGLSGWLYLRRVSRFQQRMTGEPPKIRKTTPTGGLLFQQGYEYRMIILDNQNADGRWNEVVIHQYDPKYGDWSRNGKRIKNMSAAELQGYFHSLTVNRWERFDTPNLETARRHYYRRTLKTS